MLIKKFWQWYEKNYKVNLGVATGLFLLQILHLLWLFTEVVVAKLFGSPFFELHNAPKIFIILIDYTEIPALFAISAVYINDLRKKFEWKNVTYFLFINLQWLHLFWITDEFVIESFAGGSSLQIPLWFAWLAIIIDYLELPVIYDTLKRFSTSLKWKDLIGALAEIKED